MAITKVKPTYKGVLMFNYVPHHNNVCRRCSILPHV